MKILAIDTATEVCSVAILEDNNVLLEKTLNSVNTHSVELMPLIDCILGECHLNLTDIDLFACDIGPGSFTGIRIGIATIKSFCDSLDKPCIGISSLEAFAYSTTPSDFSTICSLINANHSNVYYGLFENNNGVIKQLESFSFKSIDDTLNYINTLEKNIFFVGNCSILFKDMIESNCKCEFEFSPINNISAKYIGNAAFIRYSEGNIKKDSLFPLYLKKSSAEN